MFLKRGIATVLVFALILPVGILSFPQAAWAASTVIFTDTCTGSGSPELTNSTSITVGDSWSSKIALDGSTSATIVVGSTECFPSASAADVGIGYTMAPDSSTNIYFVSLRWLPNTAGSNDALGMLVNYINATNYYACVTNDDASGEVDAYILKQRTGGNSTLASATDIARTLNGDTLECWIDYSGAEPVLSFYDRTESAYLIASTTDSSNPLAQDGTGGVQVGANPARTDDDIKNERDPQLDKAMEVLKSEIQNSKS